MSAQGPGGLLGDFLTDPNRLVPALIDASVGYLAGSWPWLAPIAVLAAAATVAGRTTLLRRRQRVLGDGARLVTVLAPPTVPAGGGEVLWAQLSGLLRPWYQRLLHGQPHVGFEYAWSSGGLSVRLWLPGSIATALVRRAVEAAWPGAHTTLTDATAPFPATHECTAGRLRLARPEILPLRTDHKSDPLRALLQAATGMADGEHALVQVLARPATGAGCAAPNARPAAWPAAPHPAHRRSSGCSPTPRSAPPRPPPTPPTAPRYARASINSPAPSGRSNSATPQPSPPQPPLPTTSGPDCAAGPTPSPPRSRCTRPATGSPATACPPRTRP